MSIFKPAYIQHVMTTQVRRNAAAERAYRTLQFIKYHNAFYDNRHRSIQAIFDSSGVFLESYEVVNCSQLVWLAYREATGIDLDANGGLGVYPTDLTNSALTSTYRIVT